MNPEIRRIKERAAYSDPENGWVTLFFDDVEFPDGRRGRYTRIVEHGGVDGVAILPFKQGLVGLAKQYRYPVGSEMSEIPRGFGESGDSRVDAAREIREEIGADVPPAALIPLGDVHPNSGLLQGKVVLFAADCSEIVLDNSMTDGEVQRFRWVRIDDAFRMAGSGEITDAITLSALLRSRCLGLL